MSVVSSAIKENSVCCVWIALDSVLFYITVLITSGVFIAIYVVRECKKLWRSRSAHRVVLCYSLICGKAVCLQTYCWRNVCDGDGGGGGDDDDDDVGFSEDTALFCVTVVCVCVCVRVCVRARCWSDVFEK